MEARGACRENKPPGGLFSRYYYRNSGENINPKSGTNNLDFSCVLDYDIG